VNHDSANLIPLLDAGALLWYVACWIGYVAYTKRRNLDKQHGLLAAMNRIRAQWATAILERDNRIVDSQVINGMVRKESFFASTTLLILASTVALLGAGSSILGRWCCPPPGSSWCCTAGSSIPRRWRFSNDPVPSGANL